MTATTTDTCGYNPNAAPKPGGGTVTFDENTITRAIAFYGTGTAGHVGVFTNDESGLLIGAGGTPSAAVGKLNTAITNGSSVSSITVAGSGLSVPISSASTVVLGTGGTTESFTANAAAAAGAHTISVTTKTATATFASGTYISDSSAVIANGSNRAVPPTLGGGTDLAGRAVAPVIYLTDITSNSSANGGDYEQGGTAANAGSPPFADALYGSWSPTVGTKPVNKNNWVLGSPDPIPATDAFGGTTTSFNEGYGSEVAWNVGGLQAFDSVTSTYQGLLPGHTYRAQSITHDTDQYHTSGGGDFGEVCTTFSVPKLNPSISTTLSSSSITVGGTIHDSSTLTGATAHAGGTVKYRYYSSLSACNAGTYATPGGTSAGDKTVTNGVVPNSDDATFNSAGTYYWRAFYSGDTGNNGASSACTDETLVVNPNTPSITTTLSNLGPVAIGTSLHDSATLHNASSNASGTAKYAFYSSLSDCQAGTFASPAGTSLGSKTVAGGLVPDSDPTGAINAAGTYYFRVFYSGDNNNTGPVSSACADETLVVNPATPSITTTLSSSSINAGDTIHDSATLDNQTSDAGGTVEYRYYSSLSDCQAGTYASTGGKSAGDKTVTNGSVPNSDDVTFNTAGTYYFRAFYSGDNNNAGPVSSACEDETLVVKPVDIKIVKTADASPVNAGDQIGFTLTVYNDGAGDAHGVKLDDVLPTNSGLAWTIDTVTSPPGAGWNGTCAINLGELTCGGANGVTVPGNLDKDSSTFTVHIVSPTTGATGGDCPETGMVDNTGNVTTTNDGSDSSSDSVCVQALVDLAITKSGSPAVQYLGQGNITWTMVVTNNGPSSDTNVKVSDPLPAGNTYVSSTTTQGTCTGGAILNCDLGSMAAGASVTITLITTPSAVGTQTNVATVSGDRPETTNEANNVAQASVEVQEPFVNPCVLINSIRPGQLIVGHKTVVTIHLSRKGESVKGIKVSIKGAGVNVKSNGANARGVIKHTLTMKRKGVLTFRPLASPSCGAQRIGVRGPFTPPVTG